MSDFSKLTQDQVNSARSLAFRKNSKGYNLDMTITDNGDKSLSIEVADGIYNLDEDSSIKLANWILYRIKSASKSSKTPKK